MLGHTLGAAGAIEAIVTVLTIREGCVPPTINLDDPDPSRRPRPDPERRRRARDVRVALSATRSGSAARTPRSSSAVGRMTDDRADGPAGRGGDARAAEATSRTAPPVGRRRRRQLLALIDRLAGLLDRSDLTELEVEAGGTGLVLRKPVGVGPRPSAAAAAAAVSAGERRRGRPSRRPRAATPRGRRPSVKAPLTGIFYASPAPGSAPYVRSAARSRSARSSA